MWTTAISAETVSHYVPCRLLTTLAGTPKAMLYGSMSFLTTDPAPITEPPPIRTPSRILQPAPIQTSSPTSIPFRVSGCMFIGTSVRSKP